RNGVFKFIVQVLCTRHVEFYFRKVWVSLLGLKHIESFCPACAFVDEAAARLIDEVLIRWVMRQKTVINRQGAQVIVIVVQDVGFLQSPLGIAAKGFLRLCLK